MLSSGVTPQQLHNLHKGQRAFCLGSGPSLREQVSLLSWLEHELTFVNSRLVANWVLPFTPSYIVMAERAHINDHRWQMPAQQGRFIVDGSPWHETGWVWIPKSVEQYIIDYGTPCFHGEFEPLRNGRSVVATMIQLAFWMGCNPIYILGCELTNIGHAWDSMDLRNEGPLHRHLKVWHRLRLDLEQAGKELVDCTPSGNLSKSNILPYRSLLEVLNGVGHCPS